MRKELGSSNDYVCRNAHIVSWYWADNKNNDGKTFRIVVHHPNFTRADGTMYDRWHSVFDKKTIANIEALDEGDPHVWADIERDGNRLSTHAFWDDELTEDIWDEEE